MEFIEALRKGETLSIFSEVSQIHQKQDDHLQQIIRELEFKFEELKNFDNCGYELTGYELEEVKGSVRESKRKRVAGAETSKLLQNDSVCTAYLKEPLGSSTPTETSSTSSNKEDDMKEHSAKREENALVLKTPPNEFKCPFKSESVKKRIQEFEKRAAIAAASSGSKIPVLTPVKKNYVVSTANKAKEERAKPQIHLEKTKDQPTKEHIYVEKAKEIPVKPRLTRNNSKILQEKNTNIKSLKEKAIDAPLVKKTVAKKIPAGGPERNKDEAPRKVTCKSSTLEKQKRDAAIKERYEKEEKAKIQAVQKVKEEKLLLLKKKVLGTGKVKGTCAEKPDEKTQMESYDIEDVVDGASTDDEDNPTKKIPAWATKENRKRQLCAQAWMDKQNSVYLWFYNRQLKYPKVEELFNIGVKTRPRTSSAVWNNSSVCL